MNNLLKRWALLSGLMALVVLSSNIVSAQTVIIDDSFGFDQDVVYYGPIRDSQMNPYGGSSFVSHAITGGDITYTVREGVVLVRTAADGALQIFGGDNFRPATWKKADFYTVINSTPGHEYTVSFDVLQWANEGGHKINGSAIDGAGVGGTLLGSSGDVGSNTTGQISFTASSNTTTIRLRGIIGYRNDKSDIGIGRLQVTDLTPATPPPPVSLVFNDFSDLSGFSLHGSAAGVGGQLRLTGAFEAQAGSAFLSNPISLAGDAAFSAAFSFQMTNPGGQSIYGPTGPHDEDGPGADGLAFVVASAPAVGASGQGIGYEGIPNSIGVEFDTWNNSPNHPYYPTPTDIYGDDDGNHIAVNINGDISSPIGYKKVSPRLNNGGLWYAWVDYNGQTTILEVRLSQSSQRPTAPSITVSRDLALALGDDVYIGFTSATGAAWENHDIVGLQFNNTCDPVIDVPGPSNSAPMADAGEDQTQEATSPAGTPVALDGSGSSDPDNDALTYVWSAGDITLENATSASPTGNFPVGETTVTLTVDDGNGETSTDEVVVTITDGTAPTLTIPGGITAECTGPNGESIELGTASATDNGDANPVITNDAPDTFPMGTTTVTWTAIDASGNATSAEQIVNVVDTTPPDVNFSLNTGTLWPPNNKMVQVASGISASDIADENPSVVITVTSDEDINGTGDGNTEVDWEVIDGSVYLRAERDGGQDGRVYTVTVVATDAAGNTTTVTGTVDVPHGQEVASADNGKGKGKAKKLVVVSQSVTPSIVVGEAKVIAGQSSGTLVTQGESVTIVGAGPVVADQLIDLSDNAEVAPAVQDRLVQRNTFLLSQNYPNPFNPETVIGYALGEASDVRLIIYNVLGQQVRELVNASQAPGQYSVRWDGRNALGAQVTSGVYIYRLVAGTQVEMRKMILLK